MYNGLKKEDPTVWCKHWHRKIPALFLVLLLPAAFGEWRRTSAPRGRVSRQSVEPAKGVFLVATPGMQDPRFRRSVVLLLEHGESGTLGLILNKATEIPLAQVLPDMEGSSRESNPLFFGGPVRLDGILFLTRDTEAPERAEHVMEDVYYSGDRSLLEQLLEEDKDSGELRIFIGNSGWSPGQLAAEIAEGAWKLVRGDSSTVFDKDLDDIWPDLIGPPSPSPFMVQRPHSAAPLSG